MWEESLGTQAGVHLIEGVRLIRGPLNTGFTVLSFNFFPVFHCKRVNKKDDTQEIY